jgi:phosphate starvation-inducible membrane PsiE
MMMEAEKASEMLDCCSILMWLVAQDDFIEVNLFHYLPFYLLIFKYFLSKGRMKVSYKRYSGVNGFGYPM